MEKVPLLALLQEMCDPHRGVAGDQIRHGISFPKTISKIKSGNFILWAIKHGMMLTIYMLDTCITNSRFIWQPLKACLSSQDERYSRSASLAHWVFGLSTIFGASSFVASTNLAHDNGIGCQMSYCTV